MNGPQKAETTLPDSTAVLAAMDTLSLAEIAPYVDTLADTPLGPDFPDPSSVISENVIDTIGVTEWTLILLSPLCIAI